MSQTYYVQGYVDIRIFVDTDVDTTQSATGSDVAELVKMKIENRVGKCEVVNHALTIEGLSK